MPQSSCRAILFTLLTLTVIGEPASAEGPEQPEWRRGYENQWCIQLGMKEACLPVGVELTRFEELHAWWHQWDELGHVIQIKYDLVAPKYDESVLSSQCLVLKSSFGDQNVLVTELASDPDEDNSSRIGIFVIVFDERFAISLSGTDPARMREIAESLMQQWSSIDG